MPGIGQYSEVGEGVISKAAIALDGGNIASLFTVVGGPVILIAMCMELTEVLDAACTMAWEANPTVAGSNVPIGAASPDLSAFAVGDFIWSELDGTALIPVDVNGGAALAQGGFSGKTWIVPVGGIDLIMSNSNPTTGIGTMYIRYRPMAVGAYIQ